MCDQAISSPCHSNIAATTKPAAETAELRHEKCWKFLRTLNPLLAITEPQRFFTAIRPLICEEDFSLLVAYLVSIRFPIRFNVVIDQAEPLDEGDGQSSPTSNTIPSPGSSGVDIEATNISLLPEDETTSDANNATQCVQSFKYPFLKNLRLESTIMTQVDGPSENSVRLISSTMSERFFLHVDFRKNGRWIQDVIVERDTQKVLSGTFSMSFYSTDDCNAHYFKQTSVIEGSTLLPDLHTTTIMPFALEVKDEMEALAASLRRLRRPLPIFKSKIDWYDAAS